MIYCNGWSVVRDYVLCFFVGNAKARAKHKRPSQQECQRKQTITKTTTRKAAADAENGLALSFIYYLLIIWTINQFCLFFTTLWVHKTICKHINALNPVIIHCISAKCLYKI